MAVNEELTGFLKEGLESGHPREQLEEILLEAGWQRDQVRSALGGFADVAFPIPVPRPKPYLFAREAFIYLVLFSTLYVSTSSLGTLLFQFIDRAIRQDPRRRLSKVQRWLTYLTLFVAAGILIGTMTSIVYNLLGGEITMRFVLRVLTLGTIAGSVFGYFLRDLRKEEVSE